MQVVRQWRISHAQLAFTTDYRIPGLLKEWWLASVSLVQGPHFAGMISIIAAHAKNASNRKAQSGADHRQCNDGVRRKCQVHERNPESENESQSVQHFHRLRPARC
jgi:hypothetical protein